MPASRKRVSLLAICCLVLGSCGGGGGTSDGGPAPVTGSTPTGVPPSSSTPPPPASDPPVTNLLPSAPFGITESVVFPLVGWQQISEGQLSPFLASADAQATLRWTASLKTYELNLVDLGSGRLFQSYASNPAALTIVQADGSVAKAYVSLWPRTASTGDLYWQSADGVSPFVYGRAVFGLPVGTLPNSGRRVFKNQDDPEGAIVFDFAAQRVSGTLTTFNDGGNWDPPGPRELGIIEPAPIQSDGSFVAVLSVAGATGKGELRGRLFGLAGNELAVYWNAPVRDGYDGAYGDWRTVIRFAECSTCTG